MTPSRLAPLRALFLSLLAPCALGWGILLGLRIEHPYLGALAGWSLHALVAYRMIGEDGLD